jgi:hypothetical protein
MRNRWRLPDGATVIASYPTPTGAVDSGMTCATLRSQLGAVSGSPEERHTCWMSCGTTMDVLS